MSLFGLGQTSRIFVVVNYASCKNPNKKLQISVASEIKIFLLADLFFFFIEKFCLPTHEQHSLYKFDKQLKQSLQQVQFFKSQLHDLVSKHLLTILPQTASLHPSASCRIISMKHADAIAAVIAIHLHMIS